MTIPNLNTADWKHLGPAAQFFRAISVVRVPLVAGVFAALVLSLPDQTLEIYRVIAENSEVEGIRPWLPLVFALAASTFALWYLARALVQANGAAADMRSETGRVLLRGLPGLCGALLPFGLGIGLLRAADEQQWQRINKTVFETAPQLDQIRNSIASSQEMILFAGSLCVELAVMVYFTAWLFSQPSKSAPADSWRFATHRFGPFGLPAALLVGGLLAFLIWRVVKYPVALPQRLGAVPIFLEFIVLLAYFASLLTARLDRRRIPALTCLLLIVLIFSAFDLNDNHGIEVRPTSTRVIPTDDQAFQDWYRSRADREYFETAGKPYPVFIVAAAGGGLYAAYHAAIVLSRLQDRCPNFAQHVFAISGVSGGSLGSAIFSSLAKSYAANAVWRDCAYGPMPVGPFEKRAQAMLAKDFLSPIVASTLFPDFLQRFLPYPFEPLSRAKALDATMEDAWATVSEGNPTHSLENPFSQPFLDHWTPAGPAPALVLNTTHVNFGYRAVISPFYVKTHTIEYSNLWNFYELLLKSTQPPAPIVESDVKLSTAVGLSARFAWITPPGTWLWVAPRGETIKFQFVDGGYFESSGIETAADLFNRLGAYEKKPSGATPGSPGSIPHISLHLLPIGGIQKQYVKTYSRLDYALGEALSPIETMLRTRERRGMLAWYRWLTEKRWLADKCGYETDGSCSFTGIDTEPDRFCNSAWMAAFVPFAPTYRATGRSSGPDSRMGW
jgi:hypothetical protein